MLNIPGPRSRYCDGISRRSFLKAGTFAFGATAFNMADVLRAETRQGTSAPHKAVINIYLGGGPSHQDMWEIKTEAPREIRGEFNPISTSVPGIQIGEVFPRIAGLMHKCVVIRSVVGCQDRHDPVQCLTGHPFSSLQPLGGRPSIGATVTRLQGSRRRLGAALRRPGRAHAAPALVGSRSGRLPRARLRSVQTRRPGHGQHDA